MDTAQSDSDQSVDSYSVAMVIALNALAPRARSRSELLAHLRKRGADLTTSEAVLDALEIQGFVNDLEFAKAWSESRQRQKKVSKRVIGEELRKKGISQDIIDEVVHEIDDETEYAMAYQLAQRKYRSCSHLDSATIYRRIAATLSQKGFDYGLTNRIVRELEGNRS